MNATTYGLDVAKQIVQMYWVDARTGEIANRRFRRDELIAFLAKQPAGRVALEASGSAHWWARKIQALGHKVVLLHAKFIRPFVQTNKTDAADARAIWTAVQQPGMRTAATKTEDQQAMLGLHRMRSLPPARRDSAETPSPRPLLIFGEQASGEYRLSARNDTVVLRADEGGQCDPFEDGYDGLAVKGHYFTCRVPPCEESRRPTLAH